LEEVECEEIERVGLLDLELPRDGFVADPHPSRLPSNESAPSSISCSPATAATATTATSAHSVQELLDHYVFPSLASATPHIVTSSKKVTTLDLPLFIEFCRRCFTEKEGRELFLQALDDRRGRNSELLREQYDRMKIAMKVPPHPTSLLFSTGTRSSWTNAKSLEM
jgi:hypothetical protein